MKFSKITFYPDEKTVSVEKGSTVLEAARQAGIYIQSVCGGDRVCGKCRVKILKGKVANIYEVGDCIEARRIKEAIHEGSQVGLEI